MTAEILAPTSENILRAADALQHGEVVGMPTETVYGLAGHAFREDALGKIFNAKERPLFDPLIIHIAPWDMLGFPPTVDPLEALARLQLVDPQRIPLPSHDQLNRLMNHFWPGPLTLILPKHSRVPELATGGLDSVGIRMPKHPVAQSLIAKAGFPVAAPSANRFGRISPVSAQDVYAELGSRISLILEGGPCEVGVESTVLEVRPSGELIILRPGGITLESLQAFLGKEVEIHTSKKAPAHPTAPGMLESHYAPRTPLEIWSKNFTDSTQQSALDAKAQSQDGQIGFLCFHADSAQRVKHLGPTQCLSSNGDLVESDQHLFRALRELDQLGLKLILSEPCPSTQGIGYAIADRLKRASTR